MSRCPDHDRPAPCIGCAGDHTAGDHTGRPRPTCIKCSTHYKENQP